MVLGKIRPGPTSSKCDSAFKVVVCRAMPPPFRFKGWRTVIFLFFSAFRSLWGGSLGNVGGWFWCRDVVNRVKLSYVQFRLGETFAKILYSRFLAQPDCATVTRADINTDI